MKLPLEGVKVLDLTHALAGPYCSTMLADHGAQVIKLEAFGAGDIARTWGTALPGGETAYFVSLHRNKKGIEINLKHPRGKELFFELVEHCDIVIENFRVGTLQKLGLDYEKAKARNPGIIYCSVSGFGQSGPYRDRPALDLILQAESGMISVTGTPGGDYVRCGVSIADLTAGMNAAFGVMAALRVKEKTGKGQTVDVSMMEGQMALLNTLIGNYLADGKLPAQMGTAYTALTPYQTFHTKTRDLAIAILQEDPAWTPKRIDAAMHAGKESTVILKDRIPVYMSIVNAGEVWYILAREISEAQADKAWKEAMARRSSSQVDLSRSVGMTDEERAVHERRARLQGQRTAAFGADQRARDRRGDGNLAALHVGLALANDLVIHLFFRIFVHERDRRAELDGVARQLGHVDDLGARNLVLELGDAAFIQ